MIYTYSLLWLSQSSLTKQKNVALSVAKGVYDGKETLTALAYGASVGRDERAPSERHKSDFEKAIYSLLRKFSNLRNKR